MAIGHFSKHQGFERSFRATKFVFFVRLAHLEHQSPLHRLPNSFTTVMEMFHISELKPVLMAHSHRVVHALKGMKDRDLRTYGSTPFTAHVSL